MKCYKCSASISKDAKFCPNCGVKVSVPIRTLMCFIESISYILSFILLIVALSFIKKSIFITFILLVIAIVIFPITFKMISKSFKFLNDIYVRIVIIVFAFIFACATILTVNGNIKESDNLNKDKSQLTEKVETKKDETIEEKLKKHEEQKQEEARQAEIKRKEEQKKAEDKKQLELNNMNTYKENCGKYTYKEIARNPENYYGKQITFTGEVIQVVEESKNSIELRINVTKNEYDFYEDTIYCTYSYKTGESRILENDIITLYGICKGSTSYISLFGEKITLPSVDIKYIDIIE